MQYSFYGGQQGKNFEIAGIFNNKIEMMADLMKRYESKIAIGDLVLISYGMPNADPDTSSYRDNATIDKDVYGHTYNATLWQKIYTEENNKDIQNTTGTEIEYVSKDFGLGYKLLAVLTGNTPIFKVEYEALKADQKPSVTVDNSNIDFPVLVFHLPASQVIALKDTVILDADEQPKVDLDSDDADNPLLQFSLPQSQQILPEHVTTIQLPANGIPKVVFNNTKGEKNADGTDKVNAPTLEFQLPQRQIVGLGNTDARDANQLPTVSMDDSDINNPKININLPRSQVLKLNPTIVLAPSEDPTHSYDDKTDVNNPELTFSLPRAVRFMYGDLLGTRVEDGGIYTLAIADAPEIEDLRTGDYYVHEGTGFIYLVTVETDTTRTFTYEACLAAPVPTVTSAAVDTYEANGTDFKVKNPIIKKSWSSPTEQIGLVLGFELPKLPNLKGEIDFVGPDEDGSISGKPTGTNEFTYSFTIPSGARIFCGDEVDDDHLTAIVDEARPGDFYLNGVFEHRDDGHMYKLGTDGEWVPKGSIKGNVGNPLNITHDYIVTPDEVATDTLSTVSTYIETQLGKKPNGNEVIAVTYRAPAPGGGTIDTAYWYYVANNTWGRAQLTGATASLIENGYKAAGDANKAYSVTYINGLLVALDTVLTASEKEIKTYSAKAIEEMLTWGNFEDL